MAIGVMFEADLDKPHAVGWDQYDRAFHDASGERAVQMIVQRLREWVAAQPPNVQARHCEHGRYVGAGHALDYLCPRCPVRSPSSDE